MSLVRCSVCKKFIGKHCELKKGKKVKPNKSRICDKFDFDETKEKTHTKLPTTRMPSIYWESKSNLKKIVEKETLLDKQVPEVSKELNEEDLSNYVSTASKE